MDDKAKSIGKSMLRDAQFFIIGNVVNFFLGRFRNPYVRMLVSILLLSLIAAVLYKYL